MGVRWAPHLCMLCHYSLVFFYYRGCQKCLDLWDEQVHQSICPWASVIICCIGLPSYIHAPVFLLYYTWRDEHLVIYIIWMDIDIHKNDTERRCPWSRIYGYQWSQKVLLVVDLVCFLPLIYGRNNLCKLCNFSGYQEDYVCYISSTNNSVIVPSDDGVRLVRYKFWGFRQLFLDPLLPSCPLSISPPPSPNSIFPLSRSTKSAKSR